MTKDTATPESLLDETLRFAKEMIADLKATEIRPSRFSGDVMSIRFRYMPPDADMPESLRRQLSQDETFIERAETEVSHPAIINAFREVMNGVMKDAGFKEAKDRRPKYFREGEFTCAGSQTMLSIWDYSLSCKTSPDKLKQALEVTDDRLRALCLKGLRSSIKRTRDFEREMEENGIDLTTDAFDLAGQLQEKGLSGPKVFLGPSPVNPKKLH
jgi:hypothetical protein